MEIFKSKALQGGPTVKKSDMSKYKAPEVVKYVDLSQELGYAYFYYDNGHETLTYEEKVKFPSFTGCQLLEPHAGAEATVKVAP